MDLSRYDRMLVDTAWHCLNAAEIGSRELDWRIAHAFDLPDGAWPDTNHWPPFHENSPLAQNIRPFTTSQDAAYDFLGNFLPSGVAVGTIMVAGTPCKVELSPRRAHAPSDRIHGIARTLPLALMVAGVTAIKRIVDATAARRGIGWPGDVPGWSNRGGSVTMESGG